MASVVPVDDFAGAECGDETTQANREIDEGCLELVEAVYLLELGGDAGCHGDKAGDCEAVAEEQ